jgi:hypothetical protein
MFVEHLCKLNPFTKKIGKFFYLEPLAARGNAFIQEALTTKYGHRKTFSTYCNQGIKGADVRT